MKFLKENLKHFLSILHWVHVGLSEEDRALIGRYFQLSESMLPKQFHIVPMLDDTMLHRVPEFVEASFVLLELFADIGFELVGRAGNDDIVFGPSHTG